MHKNWLTAFFLSLILGGLGADRFYLGKPGTAILKILTLGGFGIWYLIDLIMIATKNVHGVVWENTGKDAVKKAWIGFAVVFVLGMVIGIAGASGDTSKKADSTNASAKSSGGDGTPTVAGTIEDKQATATPAPAPTPAATTPTPTAKAPAPAPAPAPAAPSATVSQKNALAKAKSYIGYTAFSHDGLVDQLIYEQFSAADATYGADNVGADWNAQAAKKAQSYMSYSSFSRQGLIDQLVYDKFTTAQATHGADSVGL
jgi:TM2 domain-containing membrane protein YozV